MAAFSSAPAPASAGVPGEAPATPNSPFRAVARAVTGVAVRAERYGERFGPYPFDTALALLVLAMMGVLLCVDKTVAISEVPWYAYPLVALSALPLIWRRRRPFSTGLVVALAAITYDRVGDLPSQHLQYGAIIAVYTVADRGPDAVRRWIPAMTVAALLASGVGVGELFYGNMFPLLSLLTAYVLGCSARTRRAYARTLEARATQLARERDLEADRAALRERERIAREMHDILGHAVTLMVVQAEAGPVVVRSHPERAEAAFEAIADAGRDAMSQLRRLLGLLDTPEDQDADPARTPQDGVDGLPDLVARVRETGLAVDVAVTGTPCPLPGDVSLAVYRLVQEALTNVVRHAGATRARVRMVWEPGSLSVDVRDDGTGSAPRKRGARRAELGGGHGLAGLERRVGAAGGTLVHGPAPDGSGFRVAGHFPLGLRDTPDFAAPRCARLTG